MTKQVLNPDFCIIGAGSGGLSFASGAAQMGASVVLLESHKMGGDYLNYGCVPSKALIAASKLGHDLSRAKDFGWSASRSKVNFEKVHDHIHNVIKEVAPNDSVERFEQLGVKVILEKGTFADKETVATTSYLIKAKRFVIATGSIPFIPPIEGLDEVPYLTNETIFDLKELPKHLVVIGGGPIGIEIAQSFLRLGSKVSVIDSSTSLEKNDPEITTQLKGILISEGLDLKENTKITKVKQTKQELYFEYKTADGKQQNLTASHLIVATGRRPNIQHLNLTAAGIKFTSHGVDVNKHLQTSNPKVYAIGDCIGSYQFTHMAGYHAGLAIRNTIFGLKTEVDSKAVPWVIYTDPELAHVGYTEEQLQAKKTRYEVLKLNFNENDRAQTEKRTDGMIKVLVSQRGYVLGTTILGPCAGELIYPWVIAIQNKLKLTAITSSIVPYPTLSDINKRVAGCFYTKKIFGPVMRSTVRFIMRWFRR